MNAFYKPDAQSLEIAARLAAQAEEATAICELAFGHTTLAKSLASSTTLSHYLGIDSDETAVASATMDFSEDDRFDFSCVTLQDWQPSASFDVCTASRIFHHLPPEDATSVLGKMATAIGHAGRLILLDSLRDYRGRNGRWLYLPYFFISTLTQQVPRERLEVERPSGAAAADAYYCLVADLSLEAWRFQLQLFPPSGATERSNVR